MKWHAVPELRRSLFLAAVLLMTNRLGLADAVVTEATDASLRAAVSGGGKITFGVDGVFLLSAPLQIGSDTTVDGTGRSIRIDGNLTNRIFEIRTNARVMLKSLWLVNGADAPLTNSSGNGTNAMGGAILNSAGALEIVGCVFSNNLPRGGSAGGAFVGFQNGAGFGGAIYSENGSLKINDSVFVLNRAVGFLTAYMVSGANASGGAIFTKGGPVELDGCLFVSNSATGGIGYRPHVGGVGRGGALMIESGVAQIVGTSFRTNSAYGGLSYHGGTGLGEGGAVFNLGEVFISAGNFVGNIATCADANASGGAVYNAGTMRGGKVSFASNRVIGGRGHEAGGQGIPGYEGRGAGLANTGQLALTNVTFLRNIASGGDAPDYGVNARAGHGYGGAIYQTNGAMSLAYATLAFNRAQPGVNDFFQAPGEGKGSDVYVGGGTFQIANSILGSSTNGSVFGSIVDGGFNLAADASAGFTNSSSLNSTDPKFGAEAEFYVPLTAQSPAVDTANPLEFPIDDQRLASRPAGPGPDRGAIEFRELSFRDFSFSANSIRFRVDNHTGSAYAVLISTNATAWSPGTEVTNTSIGPREFVFPADGAMRFWQAAPRP